MSEDIQDLKHRASKLSTLLAGVNAQINAYRCDEIAAGREVRSVSDHALLRYLERHKGIDMEAVRDEIRTMANEAEPLKDRETHAHPSGVVMIIGADGQVITVLSGEQSQKYVGRKLANGKVLVYARPA